VPAVNVELNRARRDVWQREGFTRRTFLAGAGKVAVAALGTQLVTARAGFAQGSGTGTLVVVFLRGGMDGLSVVVPADDPHLAEARPRIGLPGSALLPLDRGFGLHPALAPLHQLWQRGQFTAVPAVSTPDVSRSHFQAQDCLERGGSSAGAVEGWLDRVLDALGAGTGFRAVGMGSTLPRSLAGDQAPMTLKALDDFKLHVGDDVLPQAMAALAALYTGIDHPMAADTTTTLAGLDTVRGLTAAGYQPAATYPDGDAGAALRELARLIKSDLGLRVACVDVGGWDTHTNQGSVDTGDMKNQLTPLGQMLGAFATDLGDRFDQVTVVCMTEFGRRVAQNASGGTDHGHGSVVLLLGGGLAGGTIHGQWPGLAPDALDQGDVAGANDYRDILGEVVSVRLGIGLGAMGPIFPDHQVTPLGIMR
jgi:uncharacterized protein (DUF1501 family)